MIHLEGERMKILIIGAGNMGGALVRGAVNSGMKVIACDTDDEKLAAMKNFGAGTTKDAVNAARVSDVVIFAVKPSSFEALLPQFEGIANPIYVSVAAGITTSYMRLKLGDVKVVRAMPNTPAMIGEGMTAIARGEGVSDSDLDTIVNIFKSVGRVAPIREDVMDAAVAMNGSSPAYFYMMLEAMIQFGEQNGMPNFMAKLLAAQSMIGAAKMVLESTESPAVLCDRVCSPGGTTIRAVESLKSDGISEIIKAAMAKCMERSKEMST